MYVHTVEKREGGGAGVFNPTLNSQLQQFCMRDASWRHGGWLESHLQVFTFYVSALVRLLRFWWYDTIFFHMKIQNISAHRRMM